MKKIVIISFKYGMEIYEIEESEEVVATNIPQILNIE